MIKRQLHKFENGDIIFSEGCGIFPDVSEVDRIDNIDGWLDKSDIARLRKNPKDKSIHAKLKQKTGKDFLKA